MTITLYCKSEPQLGILNVITAAKEQDILQDKIRTLVLACSLLMAGDAKLQRTCTSNIGTYCCSMWRNT